MKILVLYASKKGSTAEVAKFISEELRAAGHEVNSANADSFDKDIHNYDAIVLGTGIYSGFWLQSLWHNLRRLLPQFQQKPVWGFSLCLRVLEPAGGDYAYQHYLPHNLLQELNLQEYRFFGGLLENITPSDEVTLHERYDGEYGHRRGDFRDWNAIRAWANQIVHKLEKLQIDSEA